MSRHTENTSEFLPLWTTREGAPLRGAQVVKVPAIIGVLGCARSRNEHDLVGFAIRAGAASGIIPFGTTAEAWGAVTALGRDRADNARLILDPGSMAWS